MRISKSQQSQKSQGLSPAAPRFRRSSHHHSQPSLNYSNLHDTLLGEYPASRHPLRVCVCATPSSHARRITQTQHVTQGHHFLEFPKYTTFAHLLAKQPVAACHQPFLQCMSTFSSQQTQSCNHRPRTMLPFPRTLLLLAHHSTPNVDLALLGQCQASGA